MAPFIDSHIHLWTLDSVKKHAWMQKGSHLARAYQLEDYMAAASSRSKTEEHDVNIKIPDGVIFIETDVERTASSEDQWTNQLDELRYLDSLVHSSPGHELIKAIVPWAPIDLGLASFQEYETQVRDIVRPETWSRIKGYRYLFQGIKDEKMFRGVVLGNATIEVLCAFGERVFEVGIDHRSGGIWQLHTVVEMIRRIRHGFPENEAVGTDHGPAFVINHLAKPDFSRTSATKDQRDSFEEWSVAMKELSSFSRVYMKLSGLFSELQFTVGQSGPQDVAETWSRVARWVEYIIEVFGAERTMFGSDWPVCNAGPEDEKAWLYWLKVVDFGLKRLHLTSSQTSDIWGLTAARVYKLDA